MQGSREGLGIDFDGKGVEMADIYAKRGGRRSVGVEFLGCFWWAVFGFLGGFVPRKR